jgi:hypothetical protein
MPISRNVDYGKLRFLDHYQRVSRIAIVSLRQKKADRGRRSGLSGRLLPTQLE